MCVVFFFFTRKFQDLGLKPETDYQIAPMQDNATGNSPLIAIHPKGYSPRLSVLMSKGENHTLRHPDKVETDDEDNDQTIHVSLIKFILLKYWNSHVVFQNFFLIFKRDLPLLPYGMPK